MTVALDSALDGPEDFDVDQPWEPDPPAAGWWARAGAFAIDVLAGLGAVASTLLVGWSSPPRGWLWWTCMVVAALLVVAIAVNRLVLPAQTGWSLGRAVFGIAVVDREGDNPAPLRLLVRDLLHLIDTLPLLLGWLWPLIDRRGRTFADILARTEVLRVDGPRPDWRRPAGAVIAGAAALSLLAAAVGYSTVYRTQRAAEQVREQIAVQGPKIVVDILSYTAESVSEDFAKAQTLVTDGYRSELVKQQDAVRENPIDNDYWVSNSAVLSSAADRATMLMLLQGQRGKAPTQRFVTASVRVDFEKAGPGEWKLANLTVLSAPKSAEDKPKPPAEKPAEAKPKPGADKPKPPAEPKPKEGGR